MADDVMVVVLLTEDLTDAAAIHRLGAEIHRQVGDRPTPRVVVDFADVRQASSATLGMLIALHAVLGRRGGAMAIANVHRDIIRMFKLTKFHKLAQLYESRQAAIISLGHVAA